MKVWYRIHKWFAVTAGSFLVMWIITGLLLSWQPAASPAAVVEAVDLREVSLPPAEIWGRLQPAESIKWLGVRRVAGKTVYEVNIQGRGVQLVDARSGERVSIDRGMAESILRRQYPAAAPVEGAEQIEHPDLFYRTGFPAWRLTTAAPESGAYYVSARNGDVVRADRWRVVQTISGKLHDFSALSVVFGSLPLLQPLVFACGAIVLAAVGTGYYLAWPRRRPR